MAVKPIPDGFHSVTPELNVKGAAKLIDFMKQAFAAEEVMRMPGPGGALMHAEVRIGDSIVMLMDAVRELPAARRADATARYWAWITTAEAMGCRITGSRRRALAHRQLLAPAGRVLVPKSTQACRRRGHRVVDLRPHDHTPAPSRRVSD